MSGLLINNESFFNEVIERLEEGKEVTIPCKGGSMLPFIRPGADTVRLAAISEVSSGDIVLFHSNGRYLLHRVLRVGEGKAEIMGDGSVSSYETCHLGDIRAKVVAIVRNGKTEVDPYSNWQRFKARLWFRLLPFRRYLLFIYVHSPSFRGISGFHKN